MSAALSAEALKLRGSLVGIVGTAAIVGGIAALSGAMLLAVSSGQPDIVAKLGPAATADWAGFLSSATQITGTGGLIGFGFVLAWMFGREFADGTVNGLFALPVSRARIAAGKLTVYGAWVACVSLAVAGMLLLIGTASGLGGLTETDAAALARIAALAVLSAGLAAPVAWIATIARSMLAGVAATVAIMVIAQVGVLAGAGGWMPLAAPTLWAMGRGEVSVAQLLLSLAVPAASTGLTLWAWKRLELHR